MTSIELKAQMLCEGVNITNGVASLLLSQNPSNVLRGGLSSGGKLKMEDGTFVNAPFYLRRDCNIKIELDKKSQNQMGVLIIKDGKVVSKAEVLKSPDWYKERVGQFAITQILTAHNKQLAGSVYEFCDLFKTKNEACKFCVIDKSCQKRKELILKDKSLFLEALSKIPLEDYQGLSLNGGMTFFSGRGIELFIPVVEAISAKYPQLPIAIEITPPEDLVWIDRLKEAGASSLMMNLECWDDEARKKIIPGKSFYCKKEMYLDAFKRAVEVFGKGKVSSCFVVGTEDMSTLKTGIYEVIKLGVVPSPLAGRYFENIPNYPFKPKIDYIDFLGILSSADEYMNCFGLASKDRAGCVACGMCDLIKDFSTRDHKSKLPYSKYMNHDIRMH